MRKIRVFIIGLMTLIGLGQLSAQQELPFISPETSSFMKQGDIPVSLYTGKINLSIPIYSIHDPDFDLPISVDYNSEGFQPKKHHGLVGLNWFLNAGGCITRQVNNIPDECKRPAVETDPPLPNGFLIQSRIKTYDKDKVFNFNSTIGRILPASADGAGSFQFLDMGGNFHPNLADDYEYMPDIFTFNFNGRTGQFFLGNDGQVRIVSENYYKVDLSGIKGYVPIKSTSKEPGELSEIKITDLDGYVYSFGGDITALEYSISIPTDHTGSNMNTNSYLQMTPVISAWHLTKITAPNGRVMEFKYTKSATSSITHTDKTNAIWQYQEGWTADGVVKNAVKTVQLEKITISDIGLDVSFHKSIESTRFYANLGDYSNKTFQLDSIVAKVGSSKLYSGAFNYEYKGTTDYGRRFLTRISQWDGQQYSFTYNHSSYPNPMQLIIGTVDQFGFWTDNSLCGLIQSVTYPTGGKTDFVFENHIYGKKLRYSFTDSLTVPTPELIDVEATIIGGARIKSIKNYSGTGILAESRLYDYGSGSESGSGSGSGVGAGVGAGKGASGTTAPNCTGCDQLQDPTGPQNSQTSSTTTSSTLLPLPNKSNPSTTSQLKSKGIYHSDLVRYQANKEMLIQNRYSMQLVPEPHVGYTQVKEIQKGDTEDFYTVYSFSDYRNNPDNPDLKYSAIKPNIFKLTILGMHTFNSLSYRRGHLLAKQEYAFDPVTQSIKPVKTTRYERAQVNNSSNTFNDALMEPTGQTDGSNNSNPDSDNYIVILQQDHNLTVARKVYYSPCYIKQIEEGVYLDMNAQLSVMINNVTYEHDSLFRITEEKKLNSDGKYYFKQYRYADNVLGSISSSSNKYVKGLINLKNASRLAEPVETVSGVINGTAKSYTGSTLTLYENITTTQPAPSRQMLLAIASPVSSYTFSNCSKGDSVSFDSGMIQAADFTHNSKLRLTGITYRGQEPITYQWNSTNLYPISRTQGSLTTTYTYKPLIGIETITDPRGVKTTYEYDSFGRLQAIKDENDKTIENYKYHYKN
jgi:YD repeat-containing protein